LVPALEANIRLSKFAYNLNLRLYILDILMVVSHWLLKAVPDPLQELEKFRIEALEGAKFCYNDGCEVVGHMKDFKLCPQCRRARYCGDACQKQDWNTGGGHKVDCGTFLNKVKLGRVT
jgi:hypothetical protein